MYDYSTSYVPWFASRPQIRYVDVTSDITFVPSNAFSNMIRLSFNKEGNEYYLGNAENPYLILWKLGPSNVTEFEMKEGTRIINSEVFSDRTKLTKVTLREGLTQIGSGAFSSCQKLTEIYLPGSLRYFGGNAFNGCTGLTSVNIPAGITEIGDHTFSGCSSLRLIKIPASVTSVGDKAFLNCDSVTDVYYGGSAAEWASLGVTGLPDDVTVHANSMCGSDLKWEFDAASGTLTVDGRGTMFDFPSDVNAPWYDIRGLVTSVMIADGVTSVGAGAFRGFTSLESVTLGNTVSLIGESAFADAAALSRVNYCGTADEWATVAIGSDNAPLTDIPTRFVYIGACGDSLTWLYDITEGSLTISGLGRMYDYNWNTTPWDSFKASIRSVVLEEGVLSIGDNAFSGCTSMTDISVANTVETIGANSLGSSVLRRNTHGKGTYLGNAENPYHILTAVDESASSFTPHEDTKIIASGVFVDNMRLRSITFPEGMISITRGAFGNCTKIASIHIPASMKYVAPGSFVTCPAITEITVAEGSEYYRSESNCLIDRATGSLVLGCKTSVIPSDGGVLAIGDYAFFGVSFSSTVAIPEGVTSIGSYAFHNCRSLTSICIPEGVTSIGSHAFSYCIALTEIEIPSTVASIEQYTFSYCSALSEIILPTSVRSIGPRAFDDCSNLSRIYYTGSEAEFAAITVNSTGGDNFYFTNAEIIYNFNRGGSCGDSVAWSFDFDAGRLTITGTGDMSAFASPEDAPWYGYRLLVNDVVIEHGVTSIAPHSFYGSEGLISIAIPASVISVGEGAFEGCSALADIYFGGTAAPWLAITVADDNGALDAATVHFTSSGTLGDLAWSLDVDTGILTISGEGDMISFEEPVDSPW
ncbi:MAG: leucine-rich repeat protein, partial [Clostridia bacterium]|nr:leucine-rich repeat protein [Clostridia bacterium]